MTDEAPVPLSPARLAQTLTDDVLTDSYDDLRVRLRRLHRAGCREMERLRRALQDVADGEKRSADLQAERGRLARVVQEMREWLEQAARNDGLAASHGVVSLAARALAELDRLERDGRTP